MVAQKLIAQTIDTPSEVDLQPLRDLIPTQPPPSLPSPPETSSPEDLLPSPEQPSPETAPDTGQTIILTEFQFVGNTVFTDEELTEAVTTGLTNKPLQVSQLLQVASFVAEVYAEKGYSTSGAVISIPKATQLQGKGIVVVEVIEGELEEIQVGPMNEGERLDLNPEYVRSRIAVAVGKPLNINRLQEALQLLQLDPLIEQISAQLSNGVRPGTSILTVKFATRDTFSLQGLSDNNRTPSVGGFRRGGAISEANLLGWGDTLRAEYRNSDGSNDVEVSYTLPINPYNGSVRFRYRTTNSTIVKPPFDEFDIDSHYENYDLTIRQPVFQTPQQEVVLGLSLERQESNNFLRGIAFPLSPGANIKGQTRITTLRLFQEWLQRNSQEVIAVRSSFNMGLDFLGITSPFDADINPDAPKNRYFTWRGQAQWARVLDRDTLFLIRSDIQISSDPLIPLEQFVLGGAGTVRGYAQNYRLKDNGIIVNAEIRLPVLRIEEYDTLVQLIPFVDYGSGWNLKRPTVHPATLASVGLGVLWQQGDIFSARLDWGIPLTPNNRIDNTWQEHGLHFSLIFNPF
ncbi:Surface antigen variable number [Crocosphaera chwakensis CCY0110]|uniref:Surface antigen variable number n=2 Tax=Crocosphaera TaxID=263510 RepID=A3IXS4_9CHRO|nr:Surface antigen variable number [Crocosphaera chwakensis CCY0110]